MNIEEEEFYPRWIARLRQGGDQCNEWNQSEWTDWWKDGFAIWFSDRADHIRGRAFAPFHFVPHQNDELYDELRRFYICLDLSARRMMRQTALETIKISDPLDAKSVILILRIFGPWDVNPNGPERIFKRPIEGIFDFIRATTDGLKSGRLDNSDSALLSCLCLIISGNATREQALSIEDTIKPLLTNVDNFRTVLNWCLKIREESRAACLEEFKRLWKKSGDDNNRAVWRTVSERLDQYFGTSPYSHQGLPHP